MPHYDRKVIQTWGARERRDLVLKILEYVVPAYCFVVELSLAVAYT